MTGDGLPDDADVLRYVKPSHKSDDGSVDGEHFKRDKRNLDLSVHWLEYFGDLAKLDQVNEARRLNRLERKPNGVMAELHVGSTRKHLEDELPSLDFIHRPLDSTDDFEADPSHSDMVGLPLYQDKLRATLIGEMIAECVHQTYPAVVDRS